MSNQIYFVAIQIPFKKKRWILVNPYIMSETNEHDNQMLLKLSNDLRHSSQPRKH